MTDIAKYCKNLKKDFTPRKKDSTKPVSCWSEKDIINKKVVDAFVIIFRTQGCSWAFKSGCSMCGYFNDSMWEKVSNEDLLKQFEFAMEKYNQEKFVKIFTSGSFLDDKEIPSVVRKKILKKLAENAEKISVESRPEYITEKKLLEIKKILNDKIFEIGIGLETADDDIRKNLINKGFTFDDYKKAARLLKKYNFLVKTYILIKPPFVTEKNAIDDAIKTIEKIKNITDVVSFNPTNVQKNTYVSYLWNRRKYRPPYLFSVIEILKQSKKIAPNVHIKCDVAGGGSIRGAHNCKNCDRSYLNAISDFSLNQDTKTFQKLNCDCKQNWLDLLDIEDLAFGSVVDI